MVVKESTKKYPDQSLYPTGIKKKYTNIFYLMINSLDFANH